MALSVIWISVAAGVLLGLWQRIGARTTGPIRTFAVVAAGLVVALSLLPHAIASEGLAGLCVALASVALVPTLERLVRVPFRNVSAEGLRLELGYVGLLVHRFGDGVVMGVDGHGSELAWAVGAHEVPIVALVVLAYARRGLAPALLRAALLGLASSCGYWLVSSLPGSWHELHGWVDAIAAGILVHILAYEALPDTLETARDRAYDGLAALLGGLVIFLPEVEGHGGPASPGRQLLDVSLEAAPALLGGLLASAAILAYAPRPRARTVWLLRPWPGVEGLALLWRGLGVAGAALYAAAGAALALTATGAMRRLEPQIDEADAASASEAPGFGARLDELVLGLGGWIALGLLGSSYIESFVAEATVPAALGVAAPLFVVALALPASVSSACAAPIAAALVMKGVPIPLALAGLILGAVLGNAVARSSAARLPVRRTLLGLMPLVLGWVALATWLSPWLAERWAPPARNHSPGVLAWCALGVLLLIAARGVWRVGVRGWLGASFRTLAVGAAARGEPTATHAHAH
jgi:hypothetical protein